MTATEASFELVSVIVRAVIFTSVLYLGVVAGTVSARVLVHNIVLDASIWRTRPWFLVEVAWSNILWVVVMDVGMLGLIFFGFGAGTVASGVLGRDIALAASIWITGPWFLVSVAWIHSVWVMMMDVGMLGLVLVWVG